MFKHWSQIYLNVVVFLLAVAAVSLPSAGLSQSTATVVGRSPDILVIGRTPLPGAEIERDKIPAETHVLNIAELSRQGVPNALAALGDEVPGLHLSDGSGNPEQPTVFYHGFAASALQGTEEGIAVYVNGIRFNQTFGDTVNWDLIPNRAIHSLSLQDSNPAFGLNALGGAIEVQLQNGFLYHGADADFSGGSFGQVVGNSQFGRQAGNISAYVAAGVTHRDGWRDFQSSDVQNLYGDLGWRGPRIEMHATLTLASSVLNGPGTSPIQLLAADPRAQFTAPNRIASRYLQAMLSATDNANATTALQANVYYSRFGQRGLNGNAPNDIPCSGGTGVLCRDGGRPSTTRGGVVIADFLNGGPYSELDQQGTDTDAFGIALQATNTDPLLGRRNHLAGGLSFDGAVTQFSVSGTIGGLSASRVFVGPGLVIDEPGQNAPSRLEVVNAYSGAFMSDTLDLTDRLTLSASGRFNLATIDLRDKGDGQLSGNHRYHRLNLAAGATYHAASWLTAYLGYAEANRAPTPAELSCASPADSCSLANFFTGDPDLKQVVTHTIEAGLRGTTRCSAGVLVSYSLGLYRTVLDDDIAFENVATLGRAFFQNVGQTRRQGIDVEVKLRNQSWLIYVDYSRIEATYQSRFTEAAGNNPAGDANGELTIVPGNQLPGIPKSLIKFGAYLSPTRDWSMGAVGLVQSGTSLFGDPSNLTPQQPGFFRLDLNSSYQVTSHFQIFARLANVTNARYSTSGTFSPTASVFLAETPGAANPRAYSPAAPIAGFAGVKLTL